MRGQRAGSSIRRWRLVLLGALVIFLGGVTALLISGRGPTSGARGRDARPAMESLADLISAGEGFEYEVTEGEQKLFNIRADRVATSRGNVIELEKVHIEVAHPSGRMYGVSADAARYHAEERSKDTYLRGDAVVRSSTGAEVRSEGFELKRKGKLVSSIGPVEYRLGDRLRGTAKELEAYLAKDRYQLSGNVRMRGGPEDPSFSLSCRRLIYEEGDRRIYAEGDVVLIRGSDELRAGRVTVTLAEDSDRVRFVRARWDVSGVESLDDELQSRLVFEADELSLDYDAVSGELRRGEFDSREKERIVVEVSDATQLARRLTTPHLVAEFADSKPISAEAFGAVELIEYVLFSPQTILMKSCSDHALAAFSADGKITGLTLTGSVELHRADVHTVGERLTHREQDDSIEVTGEPAEVHTRRGNLLAPAIVHTGGRGEVEASGGVRATLPPGSGFAVIRDPVPSRDSIRVTSKQASWRTDGSRYTFSGAVRAWQNEDFVIADELIGEDQGRSLRAVGKVRTVIESRRSDDPTATKEERAPIEVTAAEMAFERPQRIIRYTGSPVARQAGRSLRCEDLELALNGEDEFERLTCRRQVVIDDPAAGRTISGDLAVYQPGTQLLEVSGRPAVMKDPAGGEIRGSVVAYDLGQGTATVRSGVQRDTGESGAGR